MRFVTGLLAGLAALRSSNGIAVNLEGRAAPLRSLTFAETSAGYNFDYRIGDEQPFTVDTTAYYFFFVRGAAGGAGGADPAAIGGQGAVVQASYALIAGEVYVAVVGQRGGKGVGTPMTGVAIPEISAGGGGGGSFVYRPQDNVLLLAAGGGGGNSYNGTYIGQDGLQSDATVGSGSGGAANPGAGGAGAGYNSAGMNAGTVQGAKGGQTKLTWAGGAVDSRQTGAQGKGGFGGGGGGGKYSGGGGGGFSGGNGGPIPGNLGRPMSPGAGGTSAIRGTTFNGFPVMERGFTGQRNALDGDIAILARPGLGAPYQPPVQDIRLAAKQ